MNSHPTINDDQARRLLGAQVRGARVRPKGKTHAQLTALLQARESLTYQQAAAECGIKDQTAFLWLTKICREGGAHRTYERQGKNSRTVIYKAGAEPLPALTEATPRKVSDLAAGVQVLDWTIIAEAPRRNGRRYFDCRCKCGREFAVSASSLARGISESCKICGNTDHGMTNSGTWSTWRNMKCRCANKANSNYPRYGGRGIAYAPEWESFESFLADMGERPQGKTLDRIDNDGSYSKANCRWATRAQQSRNKSNSVFIEFEGGTYSFIDLAAHLRMNDSTLHYRLKKGIDLRAPRMTKNRRDEA